MAEEFENKNQISDLKSKLIEIDRIGEDSSFEDKEIWKVIKAVQDFYLYFFVCENTNLYFKVSKSKMRKNYDK